MNTKDEALKLALEAVEWMNGDTAPTPSKPFKEIAKIIREALAVQPAQDDPCIDGSCSCCWSHLDGGPAQQDPNYSICPTCGGMASDPIVPPSDRLTSKP